MSKQGGEAMTLQIKAPATLSKESLNAFIDEVEQVADFGRRWGFDGVECTRYRTLNDGDEMFGLEVTLRYSRSDYVKLVLERLGPALGQTFESRSETYRITGLNPSSKFFILTETGDGRVFKFRRKAVQEAVQGA